MWNFLIFFYTASWWRRGTPLLAVTVLCCSASYCNLAALCSSVSLETLASWDRLSCCNLAALCSSVSLASWDRFSCRAVPLSWSPLYIQSSMVSLSLFFFLLLASLLLRNRSSRCSVVSEACLDLSCSLLHQSLFSLEARSFCELEESSMLEHILWYTFHIRCKFNKIM